MDDLYFKLFSLFEPYCEAVMAAKNGEIVYKNAAARALLPKEAALVSEALPPGVLAVLSDGKGRFTVQTDIGEVTYTVTAETIAEFVVYTILPGETAVRLGKAEILALAGRHMKEPLFTISMAESLLSARIDSCLDPAAARYLAMITQSHYRLARLSGNATIYRDFVADGRSARKLRIDLVKVCANLTDSVATVARTTGTRVEFFTQLKEAPAEVDPEMLEQMILNFISNSMRHSPKDGRIVLSLLHNTSKYLLRVSDDGSGIAPDILSKIFGGISAPQKIPFSEEGLGLGLPICWYIAKIHGGSLFIESSPGKGCSVTASVSDSLEKRSEVKDSLEAYNCENISKLVTELADVLDFRDFRPELFD